MLVEEAINVREVLLDRPLFERDEIASLEKAIASGRYSEVSQELADLEARVRQGDASERDQLALGVTSFLMGRHEIADECLLELSDNPVAEFYRSQALMALEQYDAAAELFEQAGVHGYDAIHCSLCRAGALRLAGRLDAAEELLRSKAREAATRAEYSYQMGCIRSDHSDTFGAIEYFERAADMDPHHSGALFRLAGENNLLGNDEEAIDLYERSLSKPPLFLGALINLGLLYEDAENYSAAAFCFRRILAAYPNHQRALLYLKDIEATGEMYYDEDAILRQQQIEQMLQVPITDFELSARSRNSLERADIFTLGDLTRTTEQDLLAGKNFGETSLHEIREILESRGLRIGQFVQSSQPADLLFETPDLSPEEKSLLDKPVTELNLSVRSRKCLSRLGIATIGELVSRTPDAMMSVRNFGVTSLNEIRGALAEQDLKLRND